MGQITVEWIYNSDAIEVSTLTLKETQLILETGLTVGGRSLREHLSHQPQKSHRIRGGSIHQPPESWDVPPLMSDWGAWLDGPALSLHPVERAALAHPRFLLRIRPA